jgi:translation initiation factor 3 subunit M
MFNFDSLFKLSNLPLIKDHPLRVLLNIFLGKELSDYQAWTASHADCMATYRTSTRLSVNKPMNQCQAGLDQAELERKIRLLTLASLTSPQVGKAVPYAQIAGALQVPEQDVEKWVIQGA